MRDSKRNFCDIYSKFLGLWIPKKNYPTYVLGRTSAGPVIPATGVSNGMGGGADLILQGNTLLHTTCRGSTPCRWCCPCAWCVRGGGGTGGGGPLWVVRGCYWPPGGPLWVVRGSYWPPGGPLWVVLRHNIIIWPFFSIPYQLKNNSLLLNHCDQPLETLSPIK